jgi:hypothetical protein
MLETYRLFTTRYYIAKGKMGSLVDIDWGSPTRKLFEMVFNYVECCNR